MIGFVIEFVKLWAASIIIGLLFLIVATLDVHADSHALVLFCITAAIAAVLVAVSSRA